ncbi:hypothetical protein EG329_011442 [Mollisiaceae sp. DMI_Dod_QoI]|nr:hypothetical protein EG329_011442 [Helotiales sp. DMI_Dod_QoI]
MSLRSDQTTEYKTVATRDSTSLVEMQTTFEGTNRNQKETTLGRRILKFLWSGKVIFIYLACCIVLSAVMLLWIDGYKARDGNEPRYSNGNFKFRSSDIITFLSIVTIFLDFIADRWKEAVLFKCAYIAWKEYNGPEGHCEKPNRMCKTWCNKGRKEALDLILDWYFPRFLRPSLRYTVALALVLIFLRMFSAPVFEGSLDWNSSSELEGTAWIASGNPTEDFSLWRYISTNLGSAAVSQAAGMASLAWENGTATDETQVKRRCRHVLNDDQLPLGSTVHNATIPCIVIHDISWPTGPAPQIVQNITYNSAQVSVSNGNPLSSNTDIPGIGILFDPTNMTLQIPPVLGHPNTSYYSTLSPAVYPSSFLFSGQLTAVVQLSKKYFYEPYLIDPFGLGHLNNSIPGPRSILWVDGSIDPEFTYTYLVVNFTAGVTIPKTSTFVAHRVIEGGSSDSPDPEATDIQSGPWVKEALYMLPDVMTTVAIMNTTGLGTWNNLFNYTENLIRYSYLGAWDTLQRAYEPNSTNLTVTLLQPRLEAFVSLTRVAVWLAMSVLFSASGISIFFLQKECPYIADVVGPASLVELKKKGDESRAN